MKLEGASWIQRRWLRHHAAVWPLRSGRLGHSSPHVFFQTMGGSENFFRNGVQADVRGACSNQQSIETTQALVAEATGEASARSQRHTRQGQVLLAIAVVIFAAGRWKQILAAVSAVPRLDLLASLLVVAALLRLAPSRARLGVVHISALLQSVFLLGSLTNDISEVKADIKELCGYMKGLSERAEWVPPRKRKRS